MRTHAEQPGRPIDPCRRRACCLLLIGVSGMAGCARRPEAAAPSLAAEPEVRVRVRTDADRLEIDADGVLVVGLPGQRGEPGIRHRGVLVATPSGSSVELSGPGGASRGGGVVEITTASAAGISIGGTRYPGRVRLHAREGVLDAVVVLPMETYLPGVLAGELPRGWHAEAMRAQAVAARTYAIHELRRAREAGRHFDLESSTLDQVFAGATDDEAARRAAFATRGRLLFDEISPDPRVRGVLRAYYSSTCGGRPASAAGVWPVTPELAFNAAAPLQAVPRECPCEASSLYRWTRQRGADELRDRLRAWGRSQQNAFAGVGSVRAIEVATRNRAGRPETFLLTERGGGTRRLRSEELRVACNAGGRGLPEITRETRVPSGDVDVTVSGRITLTGRGFGHGVGLCQFGAEGYARRGLTHREMLERFYPGAVMRRAW